MHPKYKNEYYLRQKSQRFRMDMSHITSEKAIINSISRRHIGFMNAVRLNQYFKNTFSATFIVAAFLDFSTVSTGKSVEVLYGFYSGAEF